MAVVNWGRRRFQAPRFSRKNSPDQAVRTAPAPGLEIAFLPRPEVLENVIAQIQSATAAYSIHTLARLFLQKPERYDVRIVTKPETVLYRLGQTNLISRDRDTLERKAFRKLRNEYYKINVNLADPVKGSFTSVARERKSGIVLGPTNYHGYQSQLRRLYDQRFSRRISFNEFQRQIEIVSDPDLVAKWKEEARKITTFTPSQDETAPSFSSESAAERHFREKHLPSLIAQADDLVIDGVSSRDPGDPGLTRAIEDAWSAEMRSPSKMMQELSGRLRSSGLHIFRHRKGMLFVSAIRPRPIRDEPVSDAVEAILRAVRGSPGINRKTMAQTLISTEIGNETAEKLRLSLAANLRWLIGEGHLIEFNDGALDLPRARPTAPAAAANAGHPSAQLPLVNNESNREGNNPDSHPDLEEGAGTEEQYSADIP